MELHFRKTGKGSPLIILHGLYGSGQNWFSIAQALSENFTVYLVDLRNHGNSPHAPEHNYHVMTRDLELFIDQHIHTKVCLLGHSMGGKVAMNYTLLHPEKVSGLVVVDIAMRSYSAGEGESPQLYLHSKIMTALASLDLDFAGSREELDKQLARQISQLSLRRYLLKNVKRDKNGKFIWGMNIEVLKKNLTTLLDRVGTPGQTFSGPVLIICGKQSGYIRQEDRHDFLSAFPAAEFAELDTGHWVHSEKPKEMIQVLRDFLM